MRHASLFSGIGGFDLAARQVGWKNVFQVEIDSYATRVLEKNFPKVKRYSDIYDLKAKKYENKIDIISGGFPCQPFSVAGKREGARDNRYLWPQMLRIIQECKPSWVVAENVYGILNIDGGMVFEQVCLDLETQGYEVQAVIIPAVGKDARHRRDRVWIIGYNVGNAQHNGPSPKPTRRRVQYKSKKPKGEKSVRKSPRASKPSEDVAHTKSGGTRGVRDSKKKTRSCQSHELSGGKRGLSGADDPIEWSSQWEVEPDVGRMAHGIPNRVDRLKGLGNAIVPQIAYEIFKIIDNVESRK